ncbi:MAG: hypothetical protein JJV98_20970 [Desulfosarcina sp.]|nr:hypothetical protein [Desulfobacterales bacterium]
MRLRNILLIAGALAGTLVVGLLPTRGQAQWLFEHGAYYFLLALVSIWSLKAWALYGKSLKTLWRQHRTALLLAVAVPVLIFFHSPPHFKILADESNLIGVSMMMHSERIAAVPIEGIISDYSPPDITTTPTKRPLLFPFLVSLIHALIGYSPSNGFLLNFLVTVAALLFFALAVSRLLGPPMALPSILLLASAPILSFYVTGSGFEALNMLFLILTFIMLVEVVTSEGDPARVEMLFLTALLLAQCRYESAIVLVLFALFLLYRLIRWKSLERLSAPGCLLPVFLLPVLWQRRMFMGLSEINRIDYGVLQAQTSPFSWQYLINNIDDNLFVLIGLNPDYGFTFPLALMALAGGYGLFRNALRGQAPVVAPVVLATASATLLALLVIISAFFWGNFGLKMDNRLALVFLPFVAFAALCGLSQIQQRLRLNARAIVIVLLMVHLVYFWPYASGQRLINGLSLPFEYQRAVSYLQKTYPVDDQLLIIAELPNLYIIQKYGAVNLNRLGRAEPWIRRQRQRFDHIIALQKIDNLTGEVTPSSFIGPPFQLSPRKNILISTGLSLRVSECRLPDDKR